MVNPRHLTLQGQSVAKPETPMLNIQKSKYKFDMQMFYMNEFIPSSEGNSKD